MSEISELCEQLDRLSREMEAWEPDFVWPVELTEVTDMWAERIRAIIALSRPVSAQDGAAGVSGRDGQGQDDLGRLTGMEEGR